MKSKGFPSGNTPVTSKLLDEEESLPLDAEDPEIEIKHDTPRMNRITKVFMQNLHYDVQTQRLSAKFILASNEKLIEGGIERPFVSAYGELSVDTGTGFRLSERSEKAIGDACAMIVDDIDEMIFLDRTRNKATNKVIEREQDGILGNETDSEDFGGEED